MKATGIVRRIDEGVIISLRLKSKENQRVSLILSKFQNIFSIFVGSDISILHKKRGGSHVGASWKRSLQA